MRRFASIVVGIGTFVATVVAPPPGRASEPAVASREGPWLERTITACDRRKTVVVEGASPDRPLPPEKARQVAALLLDLMRFCDEEIRARLTVRQEIFLSVNGRPYERYAIGSELPVRPVHGKPHTPREQAIWQAEYDKLVREGDRLFHSSELGTNGISCDMCHPNAANTHPETYPKFQTQLNKMALLRDMANWCIENPLEGKRLADDDPRMKALEAYMLSQRKGVALAPGKH